jgi:hypothetical protein
MNSNQLTVSDKCLVWRRTYNRSFRKLDPVESRAVQLEAQFDRRLQAWVIHTIPFQAF